MTGRRRLLTAAILVVAAVLGPPRTAAAQDDPGHIDVQVFLDGQPKNFTPPPGDPLQNYVRSLRSILTVANLPNANAVDVIGTLDVPVALHLDAQQIDSATVRPNSASSSVHGTWGRARTTRLGRRSVTWSARSNCSRTPATPTH